ncbi:MAG: hypothetical protein Q9222_006650 [Ikaeria aurantiellina]
MTSKTSTSAAQNSAAVKSNNTASDPKSKIAGEQKKSGVEAAALKQQKQQSATSSAGGQKSEQGQQQQQVKKKTKMSKAEELEWLQRALPLLSLSSSTRANKLSDRRAYSPANRSGVKDSLSLVIEASEILPQMDDNNLAGPGSLVERSLAVLEEMKRVRYRTYAAQYKEIISFIALRGRVTDLENVLSISEALAWTNNHELSHNYLVFAKRGILECVEMVVKKTTGFLKAQADVPSTVQRNESLTERVESIAAVVTPLRDIILKGKNRSDKWTQEEVESLRTYATATMEAIPNFKTNFNEDFDRMRRQLVGTKYLTGLEHNQQARTIANVAANGKSNQQNSNKWKRMSTIFSSVKGRPEGRLTHLEALQGHVKDIPAKERDQITRLHMITWFGELRSRLMVLDDRIDVAKALEEAHDGKPTHTYTSYLGTYLKKALRSVLVAIQELRIAQSMIKGTPKSDIEDAAMIVDLLAVSATELLESILEDDSQRVVMDQEQLDSMWKKVTDLKRDIGSWKAGSNDELERMLKELIEAFEPASEQNVLTQYRWKVT